MKKKRGTNIIEDDLFCCDELLPKDKFENTNN